MEIVLLHVHIDIHRVDDVYFVVVGAVSMIKERIQPKEGCILAIDALDGSRASVWIDPAQRWYLVKDEDGFCTVKHKTMYITLPKAEYEKLFEVHHAE